MKKTKLAKKIDQTLESMPREQLIKLAEAGLMPLRNPNKYQEMVKQAMPAFVKEMETKEDMGTSIWQSTQEFMLVLIDCLKRYHNWSEIEVRQLLKELTDVLTGVKEFEKSGLSILSVHDVGVVGDHVEQKGIGGLLAEIAQARHSKARIAKLGFEIPDLPGSQAFQNKLNGR